MLSSPRAGMVCTCGQDFCYGCHRSSDSCMCGSRVRAHCGYCSRKGHLKRDCPRITCFACSQKGHTTRQCPNTPVCATCYQSHSPTKSCPVSRLPVTISQRRYRDQASTTSSSWWVWSITAVVISVVFLVYRYYSHRQEEPQVSTALSLVYNF